MKNLVIVESPSKSKTIEKYLGDDYKVISSKGHIRDLATSGKFGLGVDVEHNFEPSYKPISGKKKLITEMKKDIKNSKRVYLATDPDREGEAISWHLYDALGLKDSDYDRVEFHEITKDVVKDAFKHPRKIDYDLVKSQETRRILDRIIGFRLSKLMQSKTGGKSAGRVQSVALKLIVDREREIQNFVPEEYYTIIAKFKEFEATLEKYKNKKIEIKTKKEADKILASLSNDFIISDIKETLKNRKGKMPFKTSTLQKEASSKLGFGSSKTMRIAQKLYEGIDIGSETTGLITYMRTDSYRLSEIFTKETFDFIKENYGSKYVGTIKKAKNAENVQDAHEAIRPTSILRTPESLKKYLSADEFKLYSLIYYRALASLMKDAKIKATSISLENNDYLFKATGSVLVFDGYLKVYSSYEKNEDVILPDMTTLKDQTIPAEEIDKVQHFTKPPARFSEASLIDEMESLGIGRPSTYAPTMETLKSRDYVKLENKKFIPTEVGIEITDKLQEFFSNIINVEYTANMEENLDEVAEAKCDNVEILRKFYNDFEPVVEKAFKEMTKKEPELTGESCPMCNNPLVIRRGKYGQFTACSNYPECKYIKKEPKIEKELLPCPKCDGMIVEKKTRRGKIFWGCNNYPKCDFASWNEPINEHCPKCNSLLSKAKDKKVCTNKECDYQENLN